MAILPINVYGDKILRNKTNTIKKIDDSLIKIVKNMFETMRNANGIGLAANQVGLDISLFVVDLSPVDGYEKTNPLVVINPEIINYSDEQVFIEEGCLSIPNLRAEVERPESIRIKYLDIVENELEIDFSDFFARVILHEYDHLHGKFFTDRVEADVKKKLKSSLRDIQNRKVEVDYEISFNG